MMIRRTHLNKIMEKFTHVYSLTKGDKTGAINLNSEQCFFNRNIKVKAIDNPRDDHYK